MCIGRSRFSTALNSICPGLRIRTSFSLLPLTRVIDCFELVCRVSEEELASMPILEVVLEQGLSLLLGPAQYLMHRQVSESSIEAKDSEDKIDRHVMNRVES
jgi:hypothetical protein